MAFKKRPVRDARAQMIVLFVVLGCARALRAERLIYVAQAATGAGDGTSWADAYQDLRDALDDVRENGGCPCQIWVVAGIYTPDRATGDRTVGFEIPDGVGVYGGFAGGELCVDERDPEAHPTILSGDLAGDDELAEPVTSNCCTSTRQPGCDNQECAEAVAAILSYCDERWYFGCPSHAQTLCCDLCRPKRCENSFNVVRVRPGASVVLDGLTVRGGEAAGDATEHVFGGGLWVESARLVIRNCEFQENAAADGAAAYFEGPLGFASIEGCGFMRNRTYGGGRAGITAWESWLDIRGSVFEDNRGVCVYLHDGVHRIVDSRFRDNVSTGPFGVGIWVDLFAEAEIDNCSFVHNVGLGGCGLLIDGYARVMNSEFIGNLAQSSGAGISSCGALLAKNSVFAGNHAGGFVFYPYEEPQAGFAGAVDNACGGAAFVNCAFVDNSAGNIGGLGGGYGVDIRNSIFWNNHHEGYPPSQTGQLSAYSNAAIDIDYSIVHGWTGSYGGVGNSGLDPMFVDADGADDIAGTEDDDLRLMPGSPAINAGDPDETYLPPVDLDGHARVLCGRVDIGAYEFGIGDYDCDEIVDLTDFANWEDCMMGPIATSDEATKPRSDEGTGGNGETPKNRNAKASDGATKPRSDEGTGGNGETPKRRNTETPKRRNVKASDGATKPRSDEGTRRNAETPKNRNAKASDEATKPQRHRRHEGGATKLRSDEGVVRRLAPAAQIAACAAFDFNGDGDVDLADFAMLQRLRSGS